MEPFTFMLTGGHPNSLGRTEEVVDTVLAEQGRMPELMDCYKSDDEVVRLRTSSAIKRVFRAEPTWFDDWADHLLDNVSTLDQPSAKWTLAQIFLDQEKRMSPAQHKRATDLLVHNLHDEDDWIVLNMTMKTLQQWLTKDAGLAPRIKGRIAELAGDKRKSVAKYAGKVLNDLADPPH